MRRFVTTLFVLGAVLAVAAGVRAEVALTVDSGKIVGQIDEKIYSHFLEHIFFSCNGGLWGELIWDRSFEGNGVSGGWRIKDGCVVLNTAAPNQRMTFGDAKWKDYEFTLEARKTGGLITDRKFDLFHRQGRWISDDLAARTGLWGRGGL